jgi:DNA-directed RNA polymerase alpha subunit
MLPAAVAVLWSLPESIYSGQSSSDMVFSPTIGQQRNWKPYPSIRTRMEKFVMASAKKTLKICPEGHKFYKSSDCPTCPTCAANNKPESGFLSKLSNPARSALEANGITTLTELAKYSEREILKLHGMGPRSIPTLRQALMDAGLSFKDAQDKNS